MWVISTGLYWKIAAAGECVVLNVTLRCLLAWWGRVVSSLMNLWRGMRVAYQF